MSSRTSRRPLRPSARWTWAISVDTSVAHLAGALGKPLWLMLPHPAEWRWLEHRDDTPWYPTARLFRQARMDDWDEVVQRMKPILAGRASRFLSEGNRCPSTKFHRLRRDRRSVPTGFTPVAVASGMSAVLGMHTGILQYLPDEDDGNRSLHWYGEWLQPQTRLLLTRLIRRDQTILEVGSRRRCPCHSPRASARTRRPSDRLRIPFATISYPPAESFGQWLAQCDRDDAAVAAVPEEARRRMSRRPARRSTSCA